MIQSLKPILLLPLFTLAIGCAPARQQNESLQNEINSYGDGPLGHQRPFNTQSAQTFEERLRQLRVEEPALESPQYEYEEPVETDAVAPTTGDAPILSAVSLEEAPEAVEETDLTLGSPDEEERPAQALSPADTPEAAPESLERVRPRPAPVAEEEFTEEDAPPPAEIETDLDNAPPQIAEDEAPEAHSPPLDSSLRPLPRPSSLLPPGEDEEEEEPTAPSTALEPGHGLDENSLKFAILGESHTVSHFGDVLVEGLNELGEVHRFAVAGSSTHTWLNQDGTRLEIGYIRDSFGSDQNLIERNRGEALLLSHSLLRRYLRSTNPNVVVIQLMDNQLFNSDQSNSESVGRLVRLLKTYEAGDQSRACFYVSATHTTGETSYPRVTNEVKRNFINNVLTPTLESENCELINSMNILNEGDVSTTDGLHLDSESATLWGQRVSERISQTLEENVSTSGAAVEEPVPPQEEEGEEEVAFEARAGFVFNFEDPDSNLLLRDGPSRGSSIIGRLPLIHNGGGVTEVLITGIANEDYYSATYDGLEGFVGQDHITFEREVAEAEIQEALDARPSPPEPGDTEPGKAAISLANVQATCNQIKTRAQAGDFRQTRVSRGTYYVMPILSHINHGSRNHRNCIGLQGKCIVRNGAPSNDVVHNIRTILYDYTTEDRTSMRCKFGYGNRSNCLDPCTTLAADQSQHPRGTVVYIPHMEGKICPQNGQPVSGCFVVDDIGGAINGWGRFDFFQGECLDYDYATSTCNDSNSNNFKAGVDSKPFYIIPRNHELAEQLKDIREDHVDNSWNYSFP